MELVISGDFNSSYLKNEIIHHLLHAGHQIKDLSESSDNVGTTFNFDLFHKFCLAIQSGEFRHGILLTETGVDAAIYANKHCGIRCATCHETYGAKVAKEQMATNVLSIGSHTVGVSTALEIIDSWLYTSFDRVYHSNFIETINEIELGELTEPLLQEDATPYMPISIPNSLISTSNVENTFKASLFKKMEVDLAENNQEIDEAEHPPIEMVNSSKLIPEKSSSVDSYPKREQPDFSDMQDTQSNISKTLDTIKEDLSVLSDSSPPVFVIEEDLPSLEEVAAAYAEMEANIPFIKQNKDSLDKKLSE